MMEIQIRSFIKGANHGQYLQALGLKHLLGNLYIHANVRHADYTNVFWKEMYMQLRAGMLLKFLAMQVYWRKNLAFSKPKSSAGSITIYGSDMIWHSGSSIFPLDSFFFGRGDCGVKIAYAPSAGSCEDGRNPEWMSTMLKKFDAISVRDKPTQTMVMENADLHLAEIVIDPSYFAIRKLLVAPSKTARSTGRVAVYSPVSNIICNKLDQWKADGSVFFNEIDRLGYYRKRRLLFDLFNQMLSPEEVLDRVAGSSLLLTSTFHGAMMALCTGTPFICIANKSVRARLNSPISDCFSLSRLVTVDEFSNMGAKQLAAFLDGSDIDQDKIDSFAERSMKWLHEAIQAASK